MIGKSIVAIIVYGLTLTGIASADVKLVGQFSDWSVYKEQIKDDMACFAATSASDKAPKNVNHGDVHFFVTSWKSVKGVTQPSLKVGYKLRTDQPPTTQIGNNKWSMYAVGDEAYFELNKIEKKIISALKKGSKLRVEAVSGRGTNIAYHFSLKGSTAAIEKVGAICK